jgi:hypothetical protein
LKDLLNKGIEVREKNENSAMQDEMAEEEQKNLPD